MASSPILSHVAFVSLALAPLLTAQEGVKPLTQAELGKLPSLGTGTTPRAGLGLTEANGADTVKPPKKKGDATTNAAGKPNETEITSEEGTFDNRTHQAVFMGKVYVKNPDFDLHSDKLTAYMKAQPKAGAATNNTTGGATPPPAVKATPPRVSTNGGTAQVDATGVGPGRGGSGKGAAAADTKAGGLEKATAEGSVVITRDRIDSDGNVAHDIGRGRKAVYEASTGDVTLTGKPSVDQGINTCMAIDDETVIVLNRSGQMRTYGGRTVTTIRENTAPATPAPNGR